MLKKKNILKIFVVLVVILLAYTYLNAVIYLNYPPCDDKSEQNDLIIEGTSLFLQSNSDVLLLLNEVEIAEKMAFDFEYAFKLTESAIFKLEKAKAHYLDAMNFGKIICDEKGDGESYAKFDYESFAEKNHLNKEIMAEVSELLKKGDVTGVYEKSVNDMDSILSTLKEIKKGISMKQKPDIKLFWSLLQQYNILGLYGNYATLVFYSI
jgi:hypothetical protein